MTPYLSYKKYSKVQRAEWKNPYHKVRYKITTATLPIRQLSWTDLVPQHALSVCPWSRFFAGSTSVKARNMCSAGLRINFDTRRRHVEFHYSRRRHYRKRVKGDNRDLITCLGEHMHDQNSIVLHFCACAPVPLSVRVFGSVCPATIHGPAARNEAFIRLDKKCFLGCDVFRSLCNRAAFFFREHQPCVQ